MQYEQDTEIFDKLKQVHDSSASKLDSIDERLAEEQLPSVKRFLEVELTKVVAGIGTVAAEDGVIEWVGLYDDDAVSARSLRGLEDLLEGTSSSEERLAIEDLIEETKKKIVLARWFSGHIALNDQAEVVVLGDGATSPPPKDKKSKSKHQTGVKQSKPLTPKSAEAQPKPELTMLVRDGQIHIGSEVFNISRVDRVFSERIKMLEFMIARMGEFLSGPEVYAAAHPDTEYNPNALSEFKQCIQKIDIEGKSILIKNDVKRGPGVRYKLSGEYNYNLVFGLPTDPNDRTAEDTSGNKDGHHSDTLESSSMETTGVNKDAEALSEGQLALLPTLQEVHMLVATLGNADQDKLDVGLDNLLRQVHDELVAGIEDVDFTAEMPTNESYLRVLAKVQKFLSELEKSSADALAALEHLISSNDARTSIIELMMNLDSAFIAEIITPTLEVEMGNRITGVHTEAGVPSAPKKKSRGVGYANNLDSQRYELFNKELREHLELAKDKLDVLFDDEKLPSVQEVCAVLELTQSDMLAINYVTRDSRKADNGIGLEHVLHSLAVKFMREKSLKSKRYFAIAKEVTRECLTSIPNDFSAEAA